MGLESFDTVCEECYPFYEIVKALVDLDSISDTKDRM